MRLTPLGNLLFRSLIGTADDHGRVQAQPAALLGRLFSASRRPPTLDALEEALEELEGDGMLRRYTKRGCSYALILGWDDRTCPWYQHLSKRAEPLYPGPDDPEDPQTELPFGQRGARRGKDQGGSPADRGPAGRDAAAAAVDGGRADAGGGGAAQPADAPRAAGGDRPKHREGGRREEAVAPAPAGSEPATPGSVADRQGKPKSPAAAAEPRGADGGEGTPHAGSNPAAPASPPAAVDATSSATPTTAAGGLPAPLALRIIAEEAGERWAPGLAAATATGLPHRQEADWLRVWGEARAAGYGEPQLRQLGAALREGRLWRNRPPLSPGKLVEHLHDLLAEACAPPGPTLAPPARALAPERPSGPGEPLPAAAAPCGKEHCDGRWHYSADPDTERRPKTWACPKRPA